MRGTDRIAGIWPLSPEKIEATVAAHLGPGRVAGNKEEPCFSRQVSMYLAKHVGGWSTTRIGKFYNGRHHTTVLHAIRKVEQLRIADDSIDALIEMLTSALNSEMREPAHERVRGWQCSAFSPPRNALFWGRYRVAFQHRHCPLP